MGQILTVKELAKYIKLTTVTIYKYVKVGASPDHKIGGRLRFDKDQIYELMKSEEEKVKRIK